MSDLTWAELLPWLTNKYACREAMETCREWHGTPQDMWRRTSRGDWLLWICVHAFEWRPGSAIDALHSFAEDNRIVPAMLLGYPVRWSLVANVRAERQANYIRASVPWCEVVEAIRKDNERC